MTLTNFIIKYNGKWLEVAGSVGAENQCVDLANAYIREVLGLPIIEWTNAVDFPSKAGDNYDWIPNTLTNIPKEGDIIVWKPSPGHIAVFIEGNVDTFKSFDQNFPTGSPCHIQNHTYLNVTGWLRAKNTVPAADTTAILQAELDIVRKKRDENWNYFIAVCEALGVGANVETAVAEAKKLSTLEDALQNKDRQLQEANTKIADLEAKMANFTNNFNEVLEENTKLSERVAKSEEMVKELGAQAKDLSEALQKVKDGMALPDWSAGKYFIAFVRKLVGLEVS